MASWGFADKYVRDLGYEGATHLMQDVGSHDINDSLRQLLQLTGDIEFILVQGFENPNAQIGEKNAVKHPKLTTTSEILQKVKELTESIGQK